MRNLFIFLVMLAVTVAAVPTRLFASTAGARDQAVPQAGSLSGVARSAEQNILSSQRVQLRNLANGQVAGSTTSGPTGGFSFSGLTPGNYMVELVDVAGKVVGISTPVSVSAGVAATVTVTASAAGAITAAGAAAGGAGILGLGTATSVAVIGAAAVTGTVVAVKSVQADASPSR